MARVSRNEQGEILIHDFFYEMHMNQTAEGMEYSLNRMPDGKLKGLNDNMDSTPEWDMIFKNLRNLLIVTDSKAVKVTAC